MRRLVTGAPPTSLAMPTTITGLISIAPSVNQASEPLVIPIRRCGLTWGELDAATQEHALAVTGGRGSGTKKCARLRSLKAKWDPTNLFRNNQNIPPASLRGNRNPPRAGHLGFWVSGVPS